jgi:hypothetical protein
MAAAVSLHEARLLREAQEFCEEQGERYFREWARSNSATALAQSSAFGNAANRFRHQRDELRMPREAVVA